MSAWVHHLNHMFERRFWGARLIEIVGFALALLMIVWICLSKVREGEDVKRLNALNAQIVEKAAEVNQLKIAVSHLERPGRLEALAHNVLGMSSVRPEREADMDTLTEISRTGSIAEVPRAGVAGAAQNAARAPSLDLAIETRPASPQAQGSAPAQLEIQVTDPHPAGLGHGAAR